MTLNLRSYRHSTFFSGNTGTAGTAQQSRGFQRSLIRHESGNKGTQLCLIESLPPYLVPAQKTPGTSSHSGRPVLEPLCPRSRVPTEFEFSRVNKGGYVPFLLTDLKSFDLPHFLIVSRAGRFLADLSITLAGSRLPPREIIAVSWGAPEKPRCLASTVHGNTAYNLPPTQDRDGLLTKKEESPMHTNPPSHADLSPLFQKRHAEFIEARQAYLNSQTIYQNTIKETARLELAAKALDAEYAQASIEWKAMAKALNVDQRKINKEADRIGLLKVDADKYRVTANMREELHGELAVQMAKARQIVEGHVTGLQGLYRQVRIEALLTTKGLPELLRELRELSSDEFSNLLNKTANQAEPVAATVLREIYTPAPLLGEVMPKNGMEMARFEASGGQTVSMAPIKSNINACQ